MSSLSEQLQNLVSRLQALGREHPANDTVKDAIALLSKVDLNDLHARSTAWHAIEADVNTLARTGVWAPSQEDEELLEQLRTSLSGTWPPQNLASSPNAQQSAQRYSVVTPPPISAPLFPPTAGVTTILPTGLVEVLNYSYFLHLLVTDQDRVLPPGKSLLSVMSKPGAMGHGGADGELPHLKDRIQDVVHKAFWDEVSETLSNPSAAVQIPRLRRFHQAPYAANHPIRLILTCPLSPTSFPLRSALTHFRELLVCLRSRCAPIRDAQIDALIRNVDDLPSLASIPDMARLVVDTVRSILELAELMKEDLSQFVVGSMSEKQLRAVLMVQAASRRGRWFSLWRPERIQERWRLGWRSGNTRQRPSGWTLERVWNYLQALVIAATLRSLVRLPTQQLHRPASTDESDQESFMARLWTLLRTEIDEQPGSGETKLVNLADEVIRVRRRLRAAVEPHAAAHDPVFALLQKRLLAAVAERVAHPVEPVPHSMLVKAVSEVWSKLRSCVEWTERVWSDLIRQYEALKPSLAPW
ncbi:uncharacterized protein B0H18DRAFT_1095137 [Fomitopsis serialis]|uniref:uncharacterized protein n=1 Tax=Fomitopsis serialis TaxID=139415 RepID=UPI002008557D|nr:uncharacterized protein B0H18DRAFT_1095137 [Neoantrodia serialis]KAH9924481.1 hypothetical protein B0H18DRAFT_1095137 [Neoantrodia serialis]